MKDNTIEQKEVSKRENITYNFQPIQHLDAIKSAIMKRYKEKAPHVELQQQHVGGLPSPPVEEKKVVLIKKEPLPSSTEIKAKIQSLQEEKHKLFQLIKQMMLQEESERRKLQKPVQTNAPAAPSVPPTNNKKKSRWAPCSADALPYYNNASYFYSRPTTMPRYGSNHPYSYVSYCLYLHITRYRLTHFILLLL